MAVIALTSASGSPGVTTTALGLALMWPRPVVLVEADPTGGSGLLAGYFRGTREYQAGLIELALAAEPLIDALANTVAPIEGTSVSFVAGTRTHTQVGALADLWAPLADAFAELGGTGQDVIVDAGRLGLIGAPTPLLDRADVVLLLTRTHLPALAAARSWCASWREDPHSAPPARLLAVGEGQPYSSREVSSVLGLPVLAGLPDDPQSAAVLHRGAEAGRSFETSSLVRGLQSTVAALQGLLAEHPTELAPEVIR